jgi:hypothetical protein
MSELTQFDLSSAIRVSRVVTQIEQEPRRARPLTFGRSWLFGGDNSLDFGIDVHVGGGIGGQRAFRVCTFGGAWNKGDSKTVTFANAPLGTAVATNLFANIPAPTGGASCAIARDGTAWYLIAAEC